jgi:hypothetical protein
MRGTLCAESQAVLGGRGGDEGVNHPDAGGKRRAGRIRRHPSAGDDAVLRALPAGGPRSARSLTCLPAVVMMVERARFALQDNARPGSSWR